MNPFEQLKQKLFADDPATPEREGAVNVLLDTLQDRGDDALQGLRRKFTDSGMDEVFASWVAKGKNVHVTPEQIKKALGADQLAAMAKKAGTSVETMAQNLAHAMPGFIDKITPDGKLPSVDLKTHLQNLAAKFKSGDTPEAKAEAKPEGTGPKA